MIPDQWVKSHIILLLFNLNFHQAKEEAQLQKLKDKKRILKKCFCKRNIKRLTSIKLHINQNMKVNYIYARILIHH